MDSRLNSSGGKLLGDHESAQAHCCAGAGGCGDGDRTGIDTGEALLVSGGAVTVRATHGEVHIASGDSTAGDEVRNHRGVESRSESHPFVQQVIPQGCRTAGDAGEGSLAPDRVSGGGKR